MIERSIKNWKGFLYGDRPKNPFRILVSKNIIGLEREGLQRTLLHLKLSIIIAAVVVV